MQPNIAQAWKKDPSKRHQSSRSGQFISVNAQNQKNLDLFQFQVPSNLTQQFGRSKSKGTSNQKYLSKNNHNNNQQAFHPYFSNDKIQSNSQDRVSIKSLGKQSCNQSSSAQTQKSSTINLTAANINFANTSQFTVRKNSSRNHIMPVPMPATAESSFNQMTIQLEKVSMGSPDTSAILTLQQLNQASTQSFSQKIQEQEEKIQFLDNYRIICEKRILDFQPEHPLPILPSHIGQKNNSNLSHQYQQMYLNKDEFTLGANSPTNLQENSEHQLNLAINQNISEPSQNETQMQIENQALNQSQFHEISKLQQIIEELMTERDQIIETLRHETLHNEEQRNQIEILRSSLQQRLQNMNLDSFLMQKQQDQSQNDSVDSYLLIQEMKSDIDFKVKEIFDLNERLQHADIQFSHVQDHYFKHKLKVDELTKDNQQLDNLLRQTKHSYDSLKVLYDENEQQKNQLLDCIEDNSNQIQKFNEELESERIKVEELNQQKTMYKRLYQDGIEIISIKEKQLTEFQLKLSEYLSSNSLQEVKVKQLELQLDDLKANFTQKADQLNTLTKINEDLVCQDQNWQQVILNKNQEIKSQQTQNQSFQDQLAIRRQECQNYKNQLDELEQSHKTMISDYEKKLQDLIQENDLNLNQIQAQNDKSFKELQTDLDIYKRKLEQRESQATRFNNELDEKESQILGLTADNIYIKSKQQDLQESFDELQTLKQQLEQNLKFSKEQNYTLSEALQGIQNNLEKAESDLQFKQGQIELLEIKLANQDSDIENLRSVLSREQKEVKECRQKIEDLKMLVQQKNDSYQVLENQLQLSQNTKIDIEAEIQILKSEKELYDKLVSDLKEYEQKEFSNDLKFKQLQDQNIENQAYIKQLESQSIEERKIQMQLQLSKSDFESQINCLNQENQQLREKNQYVETESKKIECKIQDQSKRIYECIQQIQDQDLRIQQINSEKKTIEDTNDAFIERLKKLDSDKQILIEEVQNQTNTIKELEILKVQQISEIKILKDFQFQIKDQVQSLVSNFIQHNQVIKSLRDFLDSDSQLQLKDLANELNQDIQLQQNFDNDASKSVFKALEMINCISQKIIAEFDQSQQDLKIMEQQINLLEKRLSTIHVNDVLQSERQQQLSIEIDNLKQQRQSDIKENEQLKSQLIVVKSQNESIKQEIQAIHSFEKSREKLDQSEQEIKDQKIKLLQQELRDSSDFSNLITQNYFRYDQPVLEKAQTVLGNMRTRYNEEQSKLQLEFQILSYENELQQLLTSEDQVQQVQQAQRIKSELSQIEMKIQSAEQKIASLHNSEQIIRSQLFEEIESSIRSRSSSFQENDTTIASLFKETQCLQNELQIKNQMIIELQNQLILQRSTQNIYLNDYISQSSSTLSMNDSLKSLHKHINEPFKVNQNHQNIEVIPNKNKSQRIAKSSISIRNVQNIENEKPKPKLNILNLQNLEKNHSRQGSHYIQSDLPQYQNSNLHSQQITSSQGYHTKMPSFDSQIQQKSPYQSTHNQNHQNSQQQHDRIFSNDRGNQKDHLKSHNIDQFNNFASTYKKIDMRELIPCDSASTNVFQQYLNKKSNYTDSYENINSLPTQNGPKNSHHIFVDEYSLGAINNTDQHERHQMFPHFSSRNYTHQETPIPQENFE
eukprot:403342201